ncbi:MAG: N-acetylmuramoyl-L-alanine amidase [Candidatus Latescibacterota bacterium]
MSWPIGTRLVILLCFAAVVSLLSPPRADASSTVNQIRYSVQFDHTRIVLDLSRKTNYELVELTDPARIAINIKRTRLSDGTAPLGVSNGIVKCVRLNQLSWGCQIVLDLREEATYKHFELNKSNDLPDRIVIDVYPVQSSTQPGLSGADRHRPSPTAVAEAAVQNRNSAGPVSRNCIVAIDAGHGGMDPGAMGTYGIVEKHLVLDISKQIVAEINRHPGYQAVLTRSSDVYLTLPRRTEIAQENSADIFVSIHLNAAKNQKARGTEVFFISPAGAAAKMSNLMSDKQSAETELGLKHGTSDEVLSLILDVNQQALMHRSSLLAENILDAMRQGAVPPARGIKQRSFAVLKTIVMPSVLVEPGFISNSHDAKYLKSQQGQGEVSAAIAAGIISYLKKYPPPSSEKREVFVHKVKKGDTLWKISRMYGSSVDSIQEANRLNRSTRLYVGQELLIMDRR